MQVLGPGVAHEGFGGMKSIGLRDTANTARSRPNAGAECTSTVEEARIDGTVLTPRVETVVLQKMQIEEFMLYFP